MGHRGEGYFLAVERRTRLLQGLARLWPLAGGTLLLTLGYLLARAYELDLVSRPMSSYWLVLGNLLVAIGGFLWGYLAPVNLAGALYLVDRRLELGERLSALYELHQGHGHPGFIPLITRKLPEKLALKRALPLRWRERIGLTCLVLVALMTLLVSPLKPLSLLGLPGASPASSARTGPAGFAGLQPKLLQRLALVERDLARLEGLQEKLGELPLPAQGELQNLREELAQLEGELLGASQENARKGRLSLKGLQKQLGELLKALEGVEPGKPPPPDLGEKLARLAEELGLERELAEDLAAGKSTKELSVSELQRELARRLEAAGRLEQLEERLSAVAGPRDREGAAARNPERSANTRAPAPGAARSKRPGEKGATPGPEGQGKATESGAETGTGLQEEKPIQSGKEGGGGEEAGTGPGAGLEQGEITPLVPPSEARELHISGVLGEAGDLERLLTKGVPFELRAGSGLTETGAPLSLRLSLRRVSAIMAARGLPEELQEVVKRYFLNITAPEGEAGG